MANPAHPQYEQRIGQPSRRRYRGSKHRPITDQELIAELEALRTAAGGDDRFETTGTKAWDMIVHGHRWPAPTIRALERRGLIRRVSEGPPRVYEIREPEGELEP